MKGFTPEEIRYQIGFEEGHPLHGLEVTMGSMTLGEHTAMLRRSLTRELNEETLAANEDSIELFVSRLLAWNMTDRVGQPVPRTREGVDSQDRRYITQIMAAWQSKMIGVSEDLGKESSSGETSQEQSLDLGSVSGSPPS
jgi:hypothetical protein